MLRSVVVFKLFPRFAVFPFVDSLSNITNVTLAHGEDILMANGKNSKLNRNINWNQNEIVPDADVCYCQFFL